MNRFDLNKKLVLSLLTRMTQSVNDDPERSIRKIADMGKRVAPGSFQKKVFGSIQGYLEDPASGYYAMFRQLAANASPDNIAVFFTNLFYCSLSYGTEINRAVERERGLFLPWSIMFDISDNQADLSMADRLISEGQSIGIYSHGFYTENISLGSLSPIISAHPDCAFILFISPAQAGDAAALSQQYRNTGFMLESRIPDAAAFETLKKAGAIYGAYRVLPQAEVSDTAADSFISSVLPYTPIAAMTIAGVDCREVERIVLSRFAAHCRTERRLPVLPCDLYSDILFVDAVISDGPMFLGVRSGGVITSFDTARGEYPTGKTVGSRPLLDIITEEQSRG